MTRSSAPLRTCIGCRASLTPDEGVRVTRASDGDLVIGRSLPGRGAWLCGRTAESCARSAAKRRAWGRALRAEVSSDAVEALLPRLRAPSTGVGGSGPER